MYALYGGEEQWKLLLDQGASPDKAVPAPTALRVGGLGFRVLGFIAMCGN